MSVGASVGECPICGIAIYGTQGWRENCHWWHGLISVLPLTAIGHGIRPAALDMNPATPLPLGYAPPPWEGSYPEGSLPGPVTAAGISGYPVESPLGDAQIPGEHPDHRPFGKLAVELGTFQVITGGARGADALAGAWVAESRGFPKPIVFEAAWTDLGAPGILDLRRVRTVLR